MLSSKRTGSVSKDNTKVQTLAAIAEILGLLEDAGKGRDWILQQAKKHRVKAGIKPTMNSYEMLRSSPPFFVLHLLRVLKNEDIEDFKDIRTLTKTFHWFYTDIVGSAHPTVLTKDQARKVWALNELLGRTETFQKINTKSDVMTITGDGMVIGFADSPEKPLRLAMELQKIISKYNQSRRGKEKLRIRTGIDTGPVYFIKDVMGKENIWGPGIIFTRRVMDLARPMQILASAKIAQDISKLSPEYKSVMHPIGNYKIKHGEKLSLFNVYGDGWGNKLAPPGKEDLKKMDLAPNPFRFLFPKIEIKLEIKNPKTMLTHHTWLWNAVNVTDKPIDQVSYFLEGDSPKEFSDMNVTIRDEENKKLKIMSLSSNKPQYKEFIVKLDRPIKPGQKRRFLKLEYDWEEPERNFVYSLATDTKKFEYLLVAPKGLEIKQRVLKVDHATRFKTHASPASQVKYFKDRTEVTWKTANLPAYDTYRFEW